MIADKVFCAATMKHNTRTMKIKVRRKPFISPPKINVAPAPTRPTIAAVKANGPVMDERMVVNQSSKGRPPPAVLDANAG
ncbi:hypothetical protein D3C84_1042870 [compost metagenome]